MAVAQQTVAPKPPKGWLATFVVAVIMIAIVAGGFIVAVDVKENDVLYNVNGVGISSVPNWVFVGRGDDGRTILLTNGSGSLAVEANRVYNGGLLPAGRKQDPLEMKRQEWLETGTVTATEIVDVTVGDRAARRFSYSGTFEDLPTPVEGAVTEISTPNNYVLFDGWADKGQYTVASHDIDFMIGTAVIP